MAGPRFFNVTATTKDENSLIRHHFVGYFRINQHGWTRIFNVTATTKDENSLMRYHFVGDFRIKILELATSHSVELAELT